MVASQIRANARESLTGKWGKAALMTLTYAIIVFVMNFICSLIPIIGGILIWVISTPISYGILVSFMKLKRNEDVTYTDFLNNGFSCFGRVWGVFGNVLLKMILPACLVVIFIIIMVVGLSGSIFSFISNSHASTLSGFGFLGIIGMIGYFVTLIYAIIKGYLYSLSYYILYDHPEMTGKQIVEESERLMMGNRWSFFWLGLTFIGWAILAGLTLGIGMLWLLPYMMVAMICFYENLAGKSNEPVTEVVSETKTED